MTDPIRDDPGSETTGADAPQCLCGDAPWRNRSTLDSFHNAFEGLYHVFNTQKSMRIQSVIVTLVLLAGWGFGVSHVELVVLLLTMVTVLVAEVFNTAVECVIDLKVTHFDPRAKTVKDVAAAGVLLCSITSLLVGIMIFANNENVVRLLRFPPQLPTRPTLGPLPVVLIGMLLLGVIIVWVKRVTGWRSFLTGGMVSGHTALGFLLATSIALVTQSMPITALALALALLLAQSRLQARIHKLSEVALGALLGVLLALILFAWPVMVSG
ncbi:MAG TPA: diacylglycerol kinase [Armatimonadetes bacterium]|nr:diacylglycerol kinase [Armatimonadota bacterium]